MWVQMNPKILINLYLLHWMTIGGLDDNNNNDDDKNNNDDHDRLGYHGNMINACIAGEYNRGICPHSPLY